MLWGGMVIVFAILADQLAKHWIATLSIANAPIVYGDYFNLIQVWNTGVSFSMFNGYGNIGKFVLIGVALTVSAFLFRWMQKETVKVKIMALALIIGGAIGNVIDRIRYGAVMDFLDFHLGEYHWPAFNLADTFICIGALVLILPEILPLKFLKEE